MKMSKPKVRKKRTVEIYDVSNDGKNLVYSTNLTPVAVLRRKDTQNKKDHVKGYHIERRPAESNLISKMNLDEMLEASKVVQIGITGEALPSVMSPNVQKYAGAILTLNKREATKSMAVKMIDDLNAHIITTNKETTNAAESERLYRKLMSEK